MSRAQEPVTFWRASVETRNFRFEAYAPTRPEARALLCSAWVLHMQQTDATLTWREVEADTGFERIEMGAAYRDGERIV